MKNFLNIALAIIGVPLYYIIFVILSYICIFILSLPIISFFATWPVSADWWLIITVTSVSVGLVVALQNYACKYKKTNYSIVFTFSVIILITIIDMIYSFTNDLMNLKVFVNNAFSIAASIFAIFEGYDKDTKTDEE